MFPTFVNETAPVGAKCPLLQFMVTESSRLQFRVEVFNLLNHPNYGNPALNISNTTTVGTITNVLRPMREVQFAARFAF